LKFAPEAWPFVAPFPVAAAILAGCGQRRAAAWVATLGAGVLLFFRDPTRQAVAPDDLILSPGCGKVTGIEIVDNEFMGPGPWLRISTFLSVLDVHIQRVPVSGRVVYSSFTEGEKVAAFRSDAHEVNQRHLTIIESGEGDRFGILQIAGLVARRVVSDLEVGQMVSRGERLGIIKFGSRVDLLTPAGYEPLVVEGQRVVDGITTMARPGNQSR
jgi:phosphatidylserine decarboxylase